MFERPERTEKGVEWNRLFQMRFLETSLGDITKIILALSLGWKEGTNTSDFAKAFDGRMWFFDGLSVHHLTFHQPIWKRHQHIPHPRHVPGWVAENFTGHWSIMVASLGFLVP